MAKRQRCKPFFCASAICSRDVRPHAVMLYRMVYDIGAASK